MSLFQPISSSGAQRAIDLVEDVDVKTSTAPALSQSPVIVPSKPVQAVPANQAVTSLSASLVSNNYETTTPMLTGPSVRKRFIYRPQQHPVLMARNGMGPQVLIDKKT